MQRFKILVIPGYKLFPIDSGGAHHQLVFLDRLQEQHSFDLIVTPVNIAPEYIGEFKKKFPGLHLIQSGYEKKGVLSNWMAFARKQYGKIVKQDFPFTYPKIRPLQNLVTRDQRLIEAVRRVSQKGYDIIQVEHTINMGLVELLPRHVLKIFVHHEIAHTRIKSDLLALGTDRGSTETYTAIAEKMELNWLKKYDGLITLSENDRELLLQKKVNIPVQSARPFAFFEGELENIYDPNGTPHLVFAGGGMHFPNKEGLGWFINESLPILRRQYPDLELIITGSWPGDIKNKYAHDPRVRFTGFIKDLKPLLKNAIMIIPVRIGSGVRIKAIAAMGNGVPVVSTPLGVSGIPGLKHRENFLEAETPEEFAKVIQELLSDQGLRKRISEQGYRLAEKESGNDQFAKERNGFYQDLFIQKNHR